MPPKAALIFSRPQWKFDVEFPSVNFKVYVKTYRSLKIASNSFLYVLSKILLYSCMSSMALLKRSWVKVFAASVMYLFYNMTNMHSLLFIVHNTWNPCPLCFFLPFIRLLGRSKCGCFIRDYFIQLVLKCLFYLCVEVCLYEYRFITKIKVCGLNNPKMKRWTWKVNIFGILLREIQLFHFYLIEVLVTLW